MQTKTLKDYKTEERNGCLLFLGPLSPAGYGHIGQKFAHRLAWEEANGRPIPKDVWVRHTCDVPNCIRPEHLLLGTPADNSADMAKRGRVKGSLNANSKLCWSQVNDIRSRTKSVADLMQEYDISRSTVFKIRSGALWKTQ